MEDKNLEIVKSAAEVALERTLLGSFVVKIITKNDKKLCEERIEVLRKKIEDLEFFQNQLNYLMDDTSKYIHVRNFLSFYFTKTDPALVETNIKIFLDYVNEKYTKDIYDTLLEKICLLNKEALKILRKIKDNLKEDNYYDWEEFIKYYPSIDCKLRYRDILTSKEMNTEMLEISFGMKTLVENDFIISMSTNYPGSIDVYNIDKFSLTSLGFLILKYI